MSLQIRMNPKEFCWYLTPDELPEYYLFDKEQFFWTLSMDHRVFPEFLCFVNANDMQIFKDDRIVVLDCKFGYFKYPIDHTIDNFLNMREINDYIQAYLRNCYFDIHAWYSVYYRLNQKLSISYYRREVALQLLSLFENRFVSYPDFIPYNLIPYLL